MCNLRPSDGDLNWSLQSIRYASDTFVKEKEYSGKIQLAAGNTLWLDPVTYTKHLRALNMYVVDESIRKELIDNNYGVLYEKHLSQLTDLFHKYSVPVARQHDERAQLRHMCINLLNSFYTPNNPSRSVQSKKKSSKKCKSEDGDSDQEKQNRKLDDKQILDWLKKEITFAYLPISGKSGDDELEEKEVYVSAVNTPSQFYVQQVYSNELLDRLNRNIADHICKTNSDDKNMEAYKKLVMFIRQNLTVEAFEWIRSRSIPLYCLARLNNEEFFRAEILECVKIEDQVKWRVFFVDFGDENVVTLDDIYPMTESQMPCRSLPFQAIECSLELAIRPPKQPVSGSDPQIFERKWSKESGDYLWSLTQDKQNYYIKLHATALSANEQTTKRSYNIALKKKAYPDSLNIAHQLVYSNFGCAELTREERTRLFLSDKGTSSLFQTDNSPKSLLLEKSTHQFIIKMIK